MSRLVALTGDQLLPERLDWVWPGYIARGVLHVTAGDAGVGKSTILTDFAAIISRGGKWPDGTTAPKGSVLFWDGEDLIQQTIVPRFLAAGGETKQFHVVRGVKDGEKIAYFSPATDMDELTDYAKSIGDLRYIVISPLNAAVGDGRDSYKDSDVRKSLAPLAELAQSLNVAVEGVAHFRKGTHGERPLDRLNGSAATSAVVRRAFAVAISDDETRRMLVRMKTNIGDQGGGFLYALDKGSVPLPAGGEVETRRVRWIAHRDGSPQRLFEAIESLRTETDESGPQDRPKVGKACRLLDELLGEGEPMLEAEIEKRAAAIDISPRTLKKAKSIMGISSVKVERIGEPHLWKMQRPLPRGEGSILNYDKELVERLRWSQVPNDLGEFD